MEVMMEETFGPVVGIMKVEGDEEALQLMNDSPYGLVRHSIFTLTKYLTIRPHQYGQTPMIKLPCKSSRTLSKSLIVVQSTSTDLMLLNLLYLGVEGRIPEGESV
jgi:hypothetical protein